MKKLNEDYSIIGNIGQDATIKTFESGKKVLNFNVAIDKSYKDENGEKKPNTKWVQIEQWGDQSSEFKISQYLKKGTLVKVTGEPIAKSFINKENEVQQELGMRMDNVLLLSKNAE